MMKVLLLLSLLFHSVAGMAHLTPSLLKAKTLQDLPVKGEPVEEEDPYEIRQRLLLEGDQVDSLPILADHFDGGIPGFYHGVASGDPLPTSIILWTRYTPKTANASVTLELRMANVDPELNVEDHLDPSKNANLHRTLITVSAESDFVAKLDVTGLTPKTLSLIHI